MVARHDDDVERLAQVIAERDELRLRLAVAEQDRKAIEDERDELRGRVGMSV